MVESKTPLIVQILRTFDRDYARLPQDVRRRATEQIERLAKREFNHPSLGLKKMAGHNDIWEARVSRNYRMTFHITTESLILRRIGPHDILRTP